MKLNAKLNLLLVPLIAVPLAALGWVAYTQQRDSLEQEALRQMQTLLNQTEQRVQVEFATVRANATLLSAFNALQRYLRVEDEGQRFQLLQPSILKLLRSYQKANPSYYEIRILLPDGYEDTRSTLKPFPNVTEEEGDTDYFISLRNSGLSLSSKILLSPDTGEPALMVSSPILSVDPAVDPILAKEELRGYLVITASLDFLEKQSQQAQLGHGGHIFFTDKEGNILFATRQQDRERQLPYSLTDSLYTMIETGSVIRTKFQGENSFIDGRQLDENLYVFAALPETEILNSSRKLSIFAVALIVGTIVISATLLYSVLRSIVLDPLTKLGRAALALGKGESIEQIGINSEDEIGELARSFESMSKSLEESHKQAAHLAYHDSLTGLPNRRFFTELVERAVTHAERDNKSIALLFLDLDDFKRVNDSLGHQTGDKLLQEVADRLTKVIRADDVITRSNDLLTRGTVARLGGDEFIILLSDLSQRIDAASVAERIVDELEAPVILDRNELYIKTSIGISTFPEDGDSADLLLKNADIAMYHAKEHGKNHYQFFKENMNEDMIQRIKMENALRKALNNNQLLLHYQPQVDTHSGKIIGAEALIRWLDPVEGLISPGDFIPLAEETGLIVPIGEWVLYEACRQNKAWQRMGYSPITVSVNISSRQFESGNLRNVIGHVLAETGMDATYLDIELTETLIMQDPVNIASVLNDLKTLGLRISMDDFGTGYSSLSMLKRLPIDCLKIDQSFVRDLTDDADDAAIIATIIAMSKSLNLDVIAEGVEKPEQLAYLRNTHCEKIQGYLASRPLPACEFTELLASEHPLLGDSKFVCDKPLKASM